MSENNQDEAWIELAKELKESDFYKKLRWAKQEPSILTGEIRAILKKFNIPLYESNVSSLQTVLPLIHTMDKNFTIEEASNLKQVSSKQIASLIKSRTSGLSEADSQSEQIIKIWLKSEDKDFYTIHIKKLLQWNKSSVNPRNINLAALLYFISKWAFQKEDLVTLIAQNYYTKGTEQS